MKSRSVYARLFAAMSLDEAKRILGLPKSGMPTPAELTKAFRTKVFDTHPDRGGDSKKMVEVNVARDYLLQHMVADQAVGQSAEDKAKEEAKHQERRRDAAKTIVARCKQEAQRGVATALAGAAIFPTWATKFDEFLEDGIEEVLWDMSKQLDDLEIPTPSTRRVEGLIKDILAKEVRVRKSYVAYRKQLESLSGPKLTFFKVRDQFKELVKIVGMVKALHADCKSLNEVNFTKEDVPDTWGDQFYSELSKFNEYAKWADEAANRDTLKALQDLLITLVKKVAEAIVMSGARDSADLDFDTFRIPEDFDWAIDVIDGKKSKNAAEEDAMILQVAAVALQ